MENNSEPLVSEDVAMRVSDLAIDPSSITDFVNQTLRVMKEQEADLMVLVSTFAIAFSEDREKHQAFYLGAALVFRCWLEVSESAGSLPAALDEETTSQSRQPYERPAIIHTETLKGRE